MDHKSTSQNHLIEICGKLVEHPNVKSALLLGHTEEGCTVDDTGQLLGNSWVQRQVAIDGQAAHTVTKQETRQVSADLHQNSRHLVVEPFNSEATDPIAGAVPVTLEVDHEHNVSIQGHRQRHLEPDVRALRETMDQHD